MVGMARDKSWWLFATAAAAAAAIIIGHFEATEGDGGDGDVKFVNPKWLMLVVMAVSEWYWRGAAQVKTVRQMPLVMGWKWSHDQRSGIG
jgi:hypothetical protein